MRLTKVFPSFTLFSSIHERSIWSVSFSPPASFSVCHLRPVTRLTANLSSSLILSPPLLSVSFSLILFTSVLLLCFHPLSSLSPSVVSHFLPSAPVQLVMRLITKASRLLQHTGLIHMVHWVSDLPQTCTDTWPTLRGFHLPSIDCIDISLCLKKNK